MQEISHVQSGRGPRATAGVLVLPMPQRLK